MTKFNNPNCDGAHCRSQEGEVRVLPYGGGGNLILCKSCFDFELAWRKGENRRSRNFELPTWKSLDIYQIGE